VNCPKCGAEVSEDASKCPACLEPLKGTPPSEPVDPFPARRPGRRVVYAGFWWRALAFAVDLVIFCVLAGIVVLAPMAKHAGIPLDDPWVMTKMWNRQILAINLAIIMAMWLFWAVMESSPWQATPGKRILRICVTDLAGKRISLARASARFFAGRGISFIPFVGSIYYLTDCIMAGVTQRKQAVHDVIAGCLVLRVIRPQAPEQERAR